MTATYFKSGAAFRVWLTTHHETDGELLVGVYKKAAATKGITYAEARHAKNRGEKNAEARSGARLGFLR